MSTRTNTRPPLTPLIGQADVVAHSEALLAADARLVTLVGGLGTGKTRVAQELAARAAARDTHEGGVWWYEAQADLTGFAHCEQIAELLGAGPRLRGITDVDTATRAVGERLAALGRVCLFDFGASPTSTPQRAPSANDSPRSAACASLSTASRTC